MKGAIFIHHFDAIILHTVFKCVPVNIFVRPLTSGVALAFYTSNFFEGILIESSCSVCTFHFILVNVLFIGRYPTQFYIFSLPLHVKRKDMDRQWRIAVEGTIIQPKLGKILYEKLRIIAFIKWYNGNVTEWNK